MKTYYPKYIEFGSDPEFFIVRTKDADGNSVEEIVSSHIFLPGKENKYEAGDMTKLFFDGVQAEMNPHHNNCRESHIKYIFQSFAHTLVNIQNIREVNSEWKGKYQLWTVPMVKINKSTIKDSPLDCRRFGCAPDFNIYYNYKKKSPNAEKHMKRYAGGHMHIGFGDLQSMRTFKNPDRLFQLVKVLDVLVGTFLVSVTGKDYQELERIRRINYGKAGTYRIQNHGLEYRVPSAIWTSHPAFASLMLSLLRDSSSMVYLGDYAEELLKLVNTEDIRRIINKVQIENAQELWYNTLFPFFDDIVFPNIDESSYNYAPEEDEWGEQVYWNDVLVRQPFVNPSARSAIKSIMTNGFSHYFNPKDVFSNWNIHIDNIINQNWGEYHDYEESGFNYWAERQGYDIEFDI